MRATASHISIHTQVNRKWKTCKMVMWSGCSGIPSSFDNDMTPYFKSGSSPIENTEKNKDQMHQPKFTDGIFMPDFMLFYVIVSWSPCYVILHFLNFMLCYAMLCYAMLRKAIFALYTNPSLSYFLALSKGLQGNNSSRCKQTNKWTMYQMDILNYKSKDKIWAKISM